MIDQIHLVHGEHQMLHAHHRDDEAVAARLRQHALAGVDQDDRKIGEEAPVAMLRVYCSWPGVSAAMKLRRGVEK